MKESRVLLILMLLAAFVSCTKDRSVQQTDSIPNGDFENWTSGLNLENWKTNSCPSCEPPFETYIVQKDSPAYHGRYAAKFIYNNLYPAVADNKFAVSGHPLFIGAYVKCNLVSMDTVSLIIHLYNNGVVVDSGVWNGTSSFSEYRHISVPISQHSSESDSALIIITGGHTRGTTGINTIFWIDNLMFE